MVQKNNIMDNNKQASISYSQLTSLVQLRQILTKCITGRPFGAVFKVQPRSPS